jgi:hypothetical protein
MLKRLCIQIVLERAYTTQVLNPWHLPKKLGSPQWPIAQYEFRIRITQRIRNRIRKIFSKVTGPQMGSIDDQNQRTKISRNCPFKL